MQIKKYLRPIKHEFQWLRFACDWWFARRFAFRSLRDGSSGIPRALIIPCDAMHVVGSRGDQAMIMVCMNDFYGKCSAKHRGIDVLIGNKEAMSACGRIGLKPIVEWRMPIRKWFPRNVNRYSHVYILGADVTDGVYGWEPAAKMLAYYDLFRMFGVEVHYLGFSWSETPHPFIRRVFDRMANGIELRVRDVVSYDRLTRFTAHRPIIQVADAALLLCPRDSSRVAPYRQWCANARGSGGLVLAINAHAMFNEKRASGAQWEKTFVGALCKVLEQHKDIRLILIPHDDRAGVSDLFVLMRVYDMIPLQLKGAVKLVREVLNADEIKALVGCCDGLIAGRMHISIASFTMKVPVLGLSYQGKFEGLWEMIGQDTWTLVAPSIVLEDDFPVLIERFVASLDILRQKIEAHIPSVLELARLNFKEGICNEFRSV